MLVSMPLNTKTVFKPPRYGYTEGAVCNMSHSEGYSCDWLFLAKCHILYQISKHRF